MQAPTKNLLLGSSLQAAQGFLEAEFISADPTDGLSTSTRACVLVGVWGGIL